MQKKKIEAKIITDSINRFGNRITTFLLTYPRFIHGELMTHRMFSRNSMSSRAMPFKKMVELVSNDPFIPIAFQKRHNGMQGVEYHESGSIGELCAIGHWERACNIAIVEAKALNEMCVTKQLCNRILEPYQWHTVLVTATEFENFFELRCPKYISESGMIHRSKKDYIFQKDYPENEDFSKWTITDWLYNNESGAEIHIQALAELMWDAYNESKPNKLKAGQWHMPFGDKMDTDKLINDIPLGQQYKNFIEEFKLKIATARCARLSYNTHDGEIDYNKDIELYERLLENNHASPFEHCARAMTKDELNSYIKGVIEWEPEGDDIPEDAFLSIPDDTLGWSRNFKGFIQYRDLLNI